MAKHKRQHSEIEYKPPSIIQKLKDRIISILTTPLGFIVGMCAFWYVFLNLLYYPEVRQNHMIQAAQDGNLTAVKDYVTHGVDVNARWNGPKGSGPGPSALTSALQYNHFDVAEYLLTHGADPNLQSGFGAMPLLQAVNRDNTPIAELLLSKGANPNIHDKEGDTPLEIAKTFNNTDIINSLKEHGAIDK